MGGASHKRAGARIMLSRGGTFWSVVSLIQGHFFHDVSEFQIHHMNMSKRKQQNENKLNFSRIPRNKKETVTMVRREMFLTFNA